MEAHVSAVALRRTGVAIVAILSVAGCFGGGDSTSADRPAPATTATSAPVTGTTVDAEAAADERARTSVQVYLDAVKAKDPTKASTVVCASRRDEFLSNVDSPKSDFVDTYSVVDTAITKTERIGGDRKVSTTLSVRRRSDNRRGTVSLDFTVSKPTDSDWCISDEVSTTKTS